MSYEFKSEEERQFADWLDVCKDCKFVVDWKYEAQCFELLQAKSYFEEVSMKTKTKSTERSLCQNTAYTPDFMVEFSDRGLDVFHTVFKKSILTKPKESPKGVLFFDTKGEFDRQQGDGRFFSLVQKLTYEKTGIWVEKIIPKKLFQKTFAPETVRWMKNRKTLTKTKLGTQSKSIEEFNKEI